MRIILLSLILFSVQSIAETINANCRIALNNTIKVTLDTDTRKITAQDRFGSKWDGVANYMYGSYRKNHFYFLPTGFGNGIEVEIDNGRIEMCYQPERCTLCTTK